MSNEAMHKLVLLLRVSFENENESFAEYSLMVNSLSIGTKNFPKLSSRDQWLKGLGEVGVNY